jgi:hypothetical protein
MRYGVMEKWIIEQHEKYCPLKHGNKDPMRDGR